MLVISTSHPSLQSTSLERKPTCLIRPSIKRIYILHIKGKIGEQVSGATYKEPGTPDRKQRHRVLDTEDAGAIKFQVETMQRNYPHSHCSTTRASFNSGRILCGKVCMMHVYK